jgi:uncharacterized protein (TIGR03435 family)
MAIASGVCLTTSRSHAQLPPAFEVASVKPNAAVDTVGRMIVSPGLYRATNVTARALVMLAFGPDGRSLLQQQVVGGPEWMGADRFNVVARMSPDVHALRDVAALVRQLLEERFQLRARRTRRPLHTYGLMLARPDGRPGPTLRVSTLDCSDAAVRARALEQPANGESWCGSRFLDGEIHAGGYTLTSLAYALSSTLKDVVRDETGLAGTFDIDLEWNPDPAALVSDKPSLFTAVQEQLGLKLVPKEAEMDVVVIDSIQHPSPD